MGICSKFANQATPTFQLRDRDVPIPRIMSSSTPPPPASDSQNEYIKKVVWHLSDVAHVESKIYELCKGDFGIPEYCHSAPVEDSNGVPISNSLFLPPPGSRLEDYFWDITGESDPPSIPDHRVLWSHLTGPGVSGLSTARTPLELSMAVGHAMLGTCSYMNSFLALK